MRKILAFSLLICILRGQETKEDQSILKSIDIDSNAAGWIDSYIRQLMLCQHIPGVSVAAVHLDAGTLKVFSKGYGDTLPGAADCPPVTEHTPLCLGQVTETFTSTLMGILVDSNKVLNLDEKIADIFDDKKLFSSEILNKELSIADILAHRSGVSSYDKILLSLGSALKQRSEILGILPSLDTMDVDKSFRKDYKRNAILTTLAGLVAEKKLGKSWEDLIRDQLLQPLGMTDSVFADQLEDDRTKVAESALWYDDHYNYFNDGSLKTIHPFGPAGSLCSSASDMVKYLAFLLQNGSEDGKQIIESISLHELFKPALEFSKPVAYNQDLYIEGSTMGWKFGRFRGKIMYVSHGSYLGYDSIIWHQPDSNIAVFVARTGSKGMPELGAEQLSIFMAEQIASRISLQQPLFNIGHACAVASSRQTDCSCDYGNVANADKYAGEYFNDLIGTIKATSFVQNGNNTLVFAFPKADATACPWTPANKEQFWLQFDSIYSDVLLKCPQACKADAQCPASPISFDGNSTDRFFYAFDDISKVTALTFNKVINPVTTKSPPRDGASRFGSFAMGMLIILTVLFVLM